MPAMNLMNIVYLTDLIDVDAIISPNVPDFAVLQFKSNGDAHLYDLGSTHGTFINKNQVFHLTAIFIPKFKTCSL